MGHFRADDDDVPNNLLNKTKVSQQTRGFIKMLGAIGGWTNVIVVLTEVSHKMHL